MSEPTESVEYDEHLHDTDDARLFLIDGQQVWIPKSVIEDDDDMGTLEVATWFCEKEELI